MYPVPRGQTPPVHRTALTAGFDFAALSRWPYPESPELQAHDAADLLLLDTAQAWWDAASRDDGGVPPAIVLEDRHGALTLPLLSAGHAVRIGQDALGQERSLDANVATFRDSGALEDAGPLSRHGIGPDLVAGARLILLQLPRSLDALEQWAHLIAEHAHADVLLLAGGRDKHMTPRQNTVLERYFSSVVPGRGRSKSRVITARGPRRGRPAPFPRTAEHQMPGLGLLALAAHGATFGGTNLDPGTAFLLRSLESGLQRGGLEWAGRKRAVDVGCGNGTIAVYLALASQQAGLDGLGGLSVVATDQSADACASTRLTASLNEVQDRIEVLRDDALSTFPDASEDLLVLNPPFHAGNTVDTRVAVRLMAASARVLRPGGELWCVWNSHLMYRPELERLVGPTRQLARDRTFTVTVSTRR
ncbi:16S RNA G1207 methylase RsmC [Citricoccus zhacaiensis]|uniref:16S RNA G1207 methylase RsmC n=1 Tax=Citricoccus zhacaiensis TaxID=489142 RepID=A0ABQ2M7H5_9MICC|nr:16S RNA G1207 methylase RsmC [Citricoccus zhacaiensis]